VAASATAIAVCGVLAFSRLGGDPEAVWEQGQAEFRAGRWDRAEAALARLARMRRPTEEDRLFRAQIEMARDKVEPALADLNSVPDGHPMGPQARLIAGQLELRRFHLRVAETYLKRALALNPKLAQARKELVYIYGMQMRRADLAVQFRALDELLPLTYDQVLLWCMTRGSIWPPLKHSEDLKQYLEADPDDRATRLALALNHEQGGLVDKAEQLLKPLPDSDADARALRARIALDRGDTEAVVRLLGSGHLEHPGLLRIQGRLALLRGDGALAIRAFTAADQAEPLDRDTLMGLGHAYRMIGDEARAAPYLALAAYVDRLSNLLAKAHSRGGRAEPGIVPKLARACEAVGRYREAKAWYKLILRQDPLDQEFQRALYRVDEQIKKSGSRNST
jgi:tetratricopeptide (TPR) repeat protein